MWKYVLAWIPMVPIAIANGLFRERILTGMMSELHAHQVSSASAILLFGIYIRVIVRKWRPDSAGQAWATGFIWLCMTVAFEFLFGHYVAGHPWGRLLQDYNLLGGRVWSIVLLWVTVAPALFYRLLR